MRHFRAVLALCVPCMVAHGQAIMRVPQDGSPMPNYWSGTNCRASGSADLLNEPIGSAQLLLNGEQVYYWHWSESGYAPWSKAVKVMFDSSHFANGTYVEVTYRVWGRWTGIMYESKSDPDPQVRNWITIFEHDDANITPDAAQVVYNLFFLWSNYSQTMHNGGSWSESDYFSFMDGSNAVFYAGHGNPDVHAATDGSTMHWAEYETARDNHIGTGIPPFNSGAPPVNFCHIVACECGKTNNFVRACYPYYMAWGGVWMEDQAVMAYRPLIVLQQMSHHANLIWDKLAAGWTAGATYQWFNEIYLRDYPEALQAWDVYPGPIRNMAAGDLWLYSGLYEWGAMRLKTVYTGDNSPPGFPPKWFRTIMEIVEG